MAYLIMSRKPRARGEEHELHDATRNHYFRQIIMGTMYPMYSIVVYGISNPERFVGSSRLVRW